jgi:hypothetical protein
LCHANAPNVFNNCSIILPLYCHWVWFSYRSDSRAALRDFFEVDANYVTIAALKALVDEGEMEASVVSEGTFGDARLNLFSLSIA